MTFIVLNRGILPVMRRCGVKGEHYGRLIDGTARLRPLSGETTNVRSEGVKSKLAGRVRSSFKSPTPPYPPSPLPHSPSTPAPQHPIPLAPAPCGTTTCVPQQHGRLLTSSLRQAGRAEAEVSTGGEREERARCKGLGGAGGRVATWVG